MEKRNIVIVSNIPEEAVAWEFDFYFKNDMELFEKSVCDKVDPSLIHKSTSNNHAFGTDDPDYYITVKLLGGIKSELLSKWEQFCTDNNVHVIGM